MRRKLALLSFVLVAAGCSTNAAVPTASHPTATASPAAISPVAGFGEGSPSPGSLASPSPTSTAAAPSPSAPAYGVLVDLFSFPDKYNVNVVGADGKPWALLRQARRTPITTPAGHAIELPNVSTSLSALYLLAGDTNVNV